MKISIAGTGMIVRTALEMLHADFEGKIAVTGIFARPQSEEKARQMLRETGHASTAVYTDYEKMLAECESDMVYIANANHVHFQYAMRAIETGHHIIVEKPIATSRAHTEQLIDMAMVRGRFFLPAFTLLYMPLYEKIHQLLPQIAPIRWIEANFSQRSSRYDRYLNGDIAPVFDPAQAGGAMMDLNIYNLCFTIGLFGQPRKCYHLARRGYNGIDTGGTLLMRYPGFTASVSAAKDSPGHNFCCIAGEKGYIEVDGTTSILAKVRLCLCGQEPVEFVADPNIHRMAYEFEQFRRIVDDPANCTINIPLVNRIAQVIATTVDHLDELI